LADDDLADAVADGLEVGGGVSGCSRFIRHWAKRIESVR
jgi:hypothetical protein